MDFAYIWDHTLIKLIFLFKVHLAKLGIHPPCASGSYLSLVTTSPSAHVPKNQGYHKVHSHHPANEALGEGDSIIM